ncbi:MAG TPA: M28 family peptidase [Chitinophagaceae bacterium]|jgi:Zn-dependent M28 family amino/carboxypeptidase|nr:M28 family peptidase [Chitinophagaceae bacterium]
MKNLFITLLLLVTANQVFAQRISSDLIMNHISYLSSDELGGRGTSTKEELKAAKYIANQFEAMHLEAKGNKGYYYDFLYKLSANIHDTNTIGVPSKKGRNVVAFLNNGAKQTVVIGAHYDHLGYGFDHNSLDPNPENKIHNGADDNASGVAGVIELARYFSLNGIKENYNFLFMTFSGEELGLIGSKKWCENPTIPLSSINYMINMDMIGRLNDSTKKLLIYGVGTSPDWINAIEKTNHYFSIKNDSAGIGPSDQTSFYLKDIPVLHFFTGQHSDYHKPTDDFNKVNIQGEALILEMIIDLVYHLDAKPKLAFLKTKNNESTKMSFKVTMGIMPDYTFEEKGLRLDGVTENKPASNAGLQQGDIILKMGDTDILNIQDYMKSLNSFNKGDEVQVLIQRRGEMMIKVVRF